MLAEDLDGWPAHGWIVIDDYQRLAASEASESFVETVVERSPVQLLVAGRVRPSWVQPRSILDGEVLEVPEGALAMTADEVEEILDGGRTELASGLVALAGGWPAVVGLAGMAPQARDVDAVLPETLYEFFAEEIYDGLEPQLRKDLELLATMPLVDRELVVTLLGPERAQQTIDDGARARDPRRARRAARASPARRELLREARPRRDQGGGGRGVPDRVGVLHGAEGAGRGVRPRSRARRPERRRSPADRVDGRAAEQCPTLDTRDLGRPRSSAGRRDTGSPRRPGRDRAPTRPAPDGAGAG